MNSYTTSETEITESGTNNRVRPRGSQAQTPLPASIPSMQAPAGSLRDKTKKAAFPGVDISSYEVEVDFAMHSLRNQGRTMTPCPNRWRHPSIKTSNVHPLFRINLHHDMHHDVHIIHRPPAPPLLHHPGRKLGRELKSISSTTR